MTTTFIYDTETTGFHKGKDNLGRADQPYLVQIGGILFDDETRRVLAEINLIAKPEHRGVIAKIPEQASDIHGITDAIAAEHGLPYKVVVPMFNQLIKKADRLVCHNVGFDEVIMLVAYCRCAYDQTSFRAKKHICTMKETTDLLKLPHKSGRKGNKWPSLMEAYKHYVDPEGFEGAHDAMEDVRATSKLFWKLVDAGVIQGGSS